MSMYKLVCLASAVIAITTSVQAATITIQKPTPCPTTVTSVSLICTPTETPCQRPILIEDVPATVTVRGRPHACPLNVGIIAPTCTTATQVVYTTLPCSDCQTIPIIDYLTVGTVTTTVPYTCPPLPTAIGI